MVPIRSQDEDLVLVMKVRYKVIVVVRYSYPSFIFILRVVNISKLSFTFSLVSSILLCGTFFEKSLI